MCVDFGHNEYSFLCKRLVRIEKIRQKQKYCFLVVFAVSYTFRQCSVNSFRLWLLGDIYNIDIKLTPFISYICLIYKPTHIDS